MRRVSTLLVVLLALTGGFAVQAQAGHLLGGGVEYLRTVGDIADDSEFDENAFGILASYQYRMSLLKIEADVEWIPDYGGTSNALIQPQAYALIGGLIYAGVGIGVGNFDGEWQSDPFYALRAGVDLSLAGLDLDVFGVYRFQDAEIIKELGKSDLDAVTFCALLRVKLGG